MTKSWKALAAGGAAVLALTGAASATAGPGKGRLHVPRAILAAVHADVTAINAKGESSKLTWDKGKVTAKSDASISLERPDGKSVTLKIDDKTKVRARSGSVGVGNPAVVFSRDGTAFLILAIQPREGPPPASSASGAPAAPNRLQGPKAPHVGLPRGAVHVDWALVMKDGKTLALAFDAGEVTAVSDSSISLKRADGKSVTLKLDAKTKIRAKDKAVKVGDRAAAFSQGGIALILLSGPKRQ